MTEKRQFIIPDLTQIVPFPWSSNPHEAKVNEESSAWINSFSTLSGDKTVKYMMVQAASYMFPYAEFEELRTCADFMNLITAMDDFTDIQDGEGAQQSADTIILAINGKPTQESSLYRMISDFRERLARKASPNAMRRFVETFEMYYAAIAKEADLRERGCVLDMESFVKLRRECSSAMPSMALIEYVHGMNLPDTVFENEAFQSAYWAGIDMLCLSNDLYSYNREQANGYAAGNIITVLMRERGFTLQQAADYIGEEHKRLFAQITDALARMPKFGASLDEEVRKFVFSVEQVVIGNIIWSLESPRYFGVSKAPLQRERLVELWEVKS